MMSSSVLLSCLMLAATLFVAADAEVVTWKPCPTAEPNTVSYCTINEVRVNPCKEASAGKPCVLKIGEIAGIEYDFTPAFESSKLEARAFWANSLMDLPFMNMEGDACKQGTTCPIKKDVKNTYKLTLPISKEYPVKPFDVKLKLWNVDKEAEQCCFMIQIKLVK